MPYVYLAVAIDAEVIATNALNAAEGFTRWVPSLVVAVGYGTSFYCLSLALNSISVGVAYAIWAGLGIVLVTLVAALTFRQIPDAPAILGMALIVAGVAVINLFSNTATH
ncbi:MAG: multidrug efflux SMR transporter [Pseudomonadota bacterium]